MLIERFIYCMCIFVLFVGYMRAPDTRQLWHNIRYTGYNALDDVSQPVMDGRTYMWEDPSMWEDINAPRTPEEEAFLND